MARARAAPIPHLHHPRTPEQPNGSTELAEVCRTPEPISSIAYLIRLESRMGDEWGTVMILCNSSWGERQSLLLRQALAAEDRPADCRLGQAKFGGHGGAG